MALEPQPFHRTDIAEVAAFLDKIRSTSRASGVGAHGVGRLGQDTTISVDPHLADLQFELHAHLGLLGECVNRLDGRERLIALALLCNGLQRNPNAEALTVVREIVSREMDAGGTHLYHLVDVLIPVGGPVLDLIKEIELRCSNDEMSRVHSVSNYLPESGAYILRCSARMGAPAAEWIISRLFELTDKVSQPLLLAASSDVRQIITQLTQSCPDETFTIVWKRAMESPSLSEQQIVNLFLLEQLDRTLRTALDKLSTLPMLTRGERCALSRVFELAPGPRDNTFTFSPEIRWIEKGIEGLRQLLRDETLRLTTPPHPPLPLRDALHSKKSTSWNVRSLINAFRLFAGAGPKAPSAQDPHAQQDHLSFALGLVEHLTHYHRMLLFAHPMLAEPDTSSAWNISPHDAEQFLLNAAPRYVADVFEGVRDIRKIYPTAFSDHASQRSISEAWASSLVLIEPTLTTLESLLTSPCAWDRIVALQGLEALATRPRGTHIVRFDVAERMTDKLRGLFDDTHDTVASLSVGVFFGLAARFNTADSAIECGRLLQSALPNRRPATFWTSVVDHAVQRLPLTEGLANVGFSLCQEARDEFLYDAMSRWVEFHAKGNREWLLWPSTASLLRKASQTEGLHYLAERGIFTMLQRYTE